MEDIIVVPARILATVIWTVFGIIVWLPLLLRVMITQAMLLFLSAIYRDRIGYNSESISDALNFYRGGFSYIWSDDGRRSYSDAAADKESNVFKSENHPNIAGFFVGLIWTVFFWGSIAFALW